MTVHAGSVSSLMSEEEEGELMLERREVSLWSRSRLGVLALILTLFFIFSSGVGGSKLCLLLLPLTLKLLVPVLLLRFESEGRIGLTRTHTCILVLRSVEGRSVVLRLDFGDDLGVRLLFEILRR
jgi:hypothetical protein